MKIRISFKQSINTNVCDLGSPAQKDHCVKPCAYNTMCPVDSLSGELFILQLLSRKANRFYLYQELKSCVLFLSFLHVDYHESSTLNASSVESKD